MPEHYGATQRAVARPAARPVAVPRRSSLAKAAAVSLASITVALAAVAALLAPGFFVERAAPAELLAGGGALPPMVDPPRALLRAPGAQRAAAAGFVMPPFAGDLRSRGESRGGVDGRGVLLPPGAERHAARRKQRSLRSSLAAAVPPGAAVPPHLAPWVAPEAWFPRVPATKNYEHVRYHKVPSGEVAYYGDKRYGPWFAEHKHEDAEEGGEEGSEDGEGADDGEINTYPSDCTSGCDLKQSRMLEAAEGMVRVALDTHKSREAAYKEQRTRNKRWAVRISKMLEKIVPPAASGVCHRTVDCEDCQGLKDEAKCRQKLGIWVPHVSVMQEAGKEATKDKQQLNEEVNLCLCGCSCE